MGPRDEDRAEERRHVHDVRVQVVSVDPVPEPGLHPVGAPRGRRHEEPVRRHAAQQAVVDHVPGLVQRHQVA